MIPHIHASFRNSFANCTNACALVQMCSSTYTVRPYLISKNSSAALPYDLLIIPYTIVMYTLLNTDKMMVE